ncbi:MAG TPA: CrcB family protein [Jatrophihabitantaceae bacterium]|jgi:CrcB protein
MLLALAVAGAAGLGAVARYLLDQFVGHRVAGDFPYGTMMINVSGSFLLGLTLGLAAHHGLGRW